MKMSKVRYWLNVDVPTQMCTIHTPDCLHQPKESLFKGVRFLERNGGWMPFVDGPTLKKYWLSLGRGYALHYCKICTPKK
jgi:hypothetical protein